MRQAAIVIIIGFICVTFAAVVMANNMQGLVTSVDVEKGMLTLKNGAQFDGVPASLLKDVKVRKVVKVEYTEKDGKKVVTKITKPDIGC